MHWQNSNAFKGSFFVFFNVLHDVETYLILTLQRSWYCRKCRIVFISNIAN